MVCGHTSWKSPRKSLDQILIKFRIRQWASPLHLLLVKGDPPSHSPTRGWSEWMFDLLSDWQKSMHQTWNGLTSLDVCFCKHPCFSYQCISLKRWSHDIHFRATVLKLFTFQMMLPRRITRWKRPTQIYTVSGCQCLSSCSRSWSANWVSSAGWCTCTPPLQSSCLMLNVGSGQYEMSMNVIARCQVNASTSPQAVKGVVCPHMHHQPFLCRWLRLQFTWELFTKMSSEAGKFYN